MLRESSPLPIAVDRGGTSLTVAEPLGTLGSAGNDRLEQALALSDDMTNDPETDNQLDSF